MKTALSVATALCLALGALCGAEKIEWDFRSATGEIPGGAPRKWAKIDARGLTPTNRNNPRANSGFQTDPGTVKAPTGAFRITVEMIPNSKLASDHIRNYDMVLFDTIGVHFNGWVFKSDRDVNVNGIMFGMRDYGGGRYVLLARLGYGIDMAMMASGFFTLPDGKTAVAVMEYDGLSRCRLFINGRAVAETTIARGVPNPGRDAMIGSSLATNSGFMGTIVKASIEYLPLPDFEIAGAGPRVIVRESKRPVALEFRSGDENTRFEDLELSGTFAGVPVEKISVEPGKVFQLPLETNLRPGKYPLVLTVTGRRDGKEFASQRRLDLIIAPVPTDAMPVRLWREDIGVAFPHDDFQKIGFNHVLARHFSHLPLEQHHPTVTAATIAELDGFAAAGVAYMDSMNITDARLHRGVVLKNRILDRGGRERAIAGKHLIPDASRPAVRSAMKEVMYAAGKLYGSHPALYGTLINTERRDRVLPSLDRSSQKRYRDETGEEIPREVNGKLAPHYLSCPNFPADRIVADDYPLLNYYRWFWKGGDGFPGLNSEMVKSFKEGAGRDDLVVMFDPAVRVPPLLGSGGEVDLLNQWVYAYPEPFRVATVAGQQQTMASGRSGQRAGIMTQMIIKRFELAPDSIRVLSKPEWVKQEPTAPYLTTPPGLLREATWAMISRHVDSIMYYGCGSLLTPDFMYTGLRFINPESAPALAEVLNNVVKPLGPMLKRLPERDKDTGIYESFAASIFAQRGGWGWGREWPTGMLMYRANLNPLTVYDESIADGALDKLKVLFIPHGDVITRSCAEKIAEFQARGGIVVADEHLAPGITPDIVIPEIVFKRDEGAKKFNLAYKQAAATLLKKLGPHYRPFVSADPEFFTVPRKYHDTDYLFVINDKRAFGGQFGKWRQVMEVGKPHTGSVTIRRDAAAVYELSRGGKVNFRRVDGGISVTLKYATNDGRLLMLLDSPISDLRVEAPTELKPGEKFTVKLEVLNEQGNAVPALLPVEVRITDPRGRVLDGSGFECAAGGKFEKEYFISVNDLAGRWKITCRDRASGLTATREFTVKEN